MDIKSLMIGDWVYNKYHGKNIKLTPYDFFTHTHNEFGEQELAPFAKPTIGKDLEPIPLTPEILEKNGFLNDGVSFWYLDFRIVLSTSKGVSLVCGRQKRFEYVHELQHALRLAGIEKEIEL